MLSIYIEIEKGEEWRIKKRAGMENIYWNSHFN